MMMTRGQPSLAATGVAAVAAAVVVALLVGIAPTKAAWNQAIVANSAATVLTGTLSADMVTSAGTCTAAAVPSACTGQVLPAGPLQSDGTYTDSTLTNSAPAGSGTFSQSVQVSSCAPIQFASAVVGGSPLLTRGGVTRQVTDPWGSVSAARFDGIDDMAGAIQTVSLASMSTSSYSFGTWFRADAGSSGNSLVGGSSSPGADSDAGWGASPSLLLGPDGRVRFEYIDSLGQTNGISSPQAYRDGRWHLAVLVVSRTLLTTTVQLYVDGTLSSQTSSLVLTLLGSGDATYWHVGWLDSSRSQFNVVPYFAGDLSGAFVTVGRSMSADEIAALYSAPSAADYQSRLGPGTQAWMLGDGTDSVYTGSVPYVTGGNPCSMARIHPFSGSTEFFPDANLAALVTQSGGGTVWSPPVPAPGPGESAIIRIWASREVTGVYDPDVAMLELRISYSHRLQLSGSTWATAMSWSDSYVQL